MKKKKKTTKRRGRPRLPEGKGRKEKLVLKCNPEEIAMVDALASRHGISRSDLLRKVLFIDAMDPDLVTPSIQNYARQLLVKWAMKNKK